MSEVTLYTLNTLEREGERERDRETERERGVLPPPLHPKLPNLYHEPVLST